MRRLTTILTACFLSCTALSQPDLDCFTRDQVKEFLRTKVERDNCYEQFNVITGEKQAYSDTLQAVRIDNVTLQKKVVRNRRIAIGGISGFILAIGLLFVD